MATECDIRIIREEYSSVEFLRDFVAFAYDIAAGAWRDSPQKQQEEDQNAKARDDYHLAPATLTAEKEQLSVPVSKVRATKCLFVWMRERYSGEVSRLH